MRAQIAQFDIWVRRGTQNATISEGLGLFDLDPFSLTDQRIVKGSGMNLAVRHDRAFETSISQIRIRQIRAEQICAEQICVLEVRTVEVRPSEVRATQIGALEIRPRKIPTRQIRTDKISVSPLTTGKTVQRQIDFRSANLSTLHDITIPEAIFLK